MKRMGELVDGEYQKLVVSSGAYVREHFFGSDPRLLQLVEPLPDEALRRLRLGGHDPRKVYAAYKAAVEHKGSPTVILARTIKGYGLGEAGEGKNVTHQQKKLNEEELREFRSRFGIPLNDEDCVEVPFYRPAEDSIEIQYLRARREALGGYTPKRSVRSKPLVADHDELFKEFHDGSEGREVSTTMAFVGMLRKMLRDPEIGKLVVPIVPDEARTFGMESLFRTVGIYSSVGQQYEPVDVNTLLYYKEAKDGQILEEGITEAGSMASFIAAGSAYATHGINTIPFFIYYSMFGLQRIGGFHLGGGGHAHARFSARRNFGADDAVRRGIAAPGRQQPRAGAVRAEFAGIRSGVCVRNRGHHPGRHSPDVQRRRKHLLLHHGDERAVRHAGDARRREGRDTEGHVPIPRFGKQEVQAASATLWKRSDSARGAAGAGNSGDEVRRCRGCMERDELQGAVHRRERSGPLEPAASGREAARAVRHGMPRRCAGRAGGGFGLFEDLPNMISKWMPRQAGLAGHRWIWTKRRPGVAARFL